MTGVPARLPRWPSETAAVAGVVDAVDDRGIFGWILDVEDQNSVVKFDIICCGNILSVGSTGISRIDVSTYLGCGENSGFFVAWHEFDLQILSELAHHRPDAVVEIYVPSRNKFLAKHTVGDLSVAQIMCFFPPEARPDVQRKVGLIEANAAETTDSFYTIGLPAGALIVQSKRVCFVTTEFHGLFKNGGIGTANTGLAIEFAEAGWEVTVLFIDCDDNGPRIRSEPFVDVAARYRSMGITLDYLPRYSEIFEQFRDIRRVSYAIYKYVRDKNYGVIYFNECGGQGFYTVMAAKAGVMAGNPKTLVVTHGPNDWTHELNSQQWAHSQLVVLSYMEKKCVEYADFVVSPSEYLLHWMKAHDWILPKSLYVEQNIVSVAGRQAVLPNAASSGRSISEIVFFGRQEVRKGVVLFCDALDRAIASGVSLAGVTITFLGKIWKIGAMNSAAYILSRSTKWGTKVRFLAGLGQIEANAYLGGAGRLAVIPSLAENSPCVVAECLQLSIPFIATSTGGTGELVAEEDRSRCLVPPQSAALAERIAACLKDGQQPSRMAIEQPLTRQRWRDFMKLSEEAPARLEKAEAGSAPGAAESADIESDGAPKPRVSICLVHYERPHFLQQAFESILAQTYPNIELVVIDDGSQQPRTLEYLREIEKGEWGIPVKVVRQHNKYLGAARNTGVRNASGEYLLFVDDDNLLMPHAVSDFIRAAQRFGADIVTGVPYSFHHRHRPDPEFDGEIRTLPLGGCAEVGFFENCYGDANALVSRRAHEIVGGFHEVHGQAVEDWEFFAKATLKGLKVEVLPKPTFWYRVLESGMFVKSDPVANARRIANVYLGYPIRNVARMLELSWEIDREQRFRMLQIAAQEGETHETLVRLSDVDPESKDAKQLLLQYMVEQRRVQEALDFALHNDVALVEDVTVAAREQMARDARDELDRYHAIVKTRLDITDHVRGRAEALFGVEGRIIDAGGVLAFTASFDAAVVRVEKVCPSGAEVITAKCAASGQFMGYEACLVVCSSGVSVDLDAGDLSAHPGVYASGWTEMTPSGEVSFRTPIGRGRADEPHDIFLIARGRSEASGVCELAWRQFEVEIAHVGASQKSVIRPRFAPRRLSERIIAEKGQPLTRSGVAPADLKWFVPGYPTTLHPIHEALAAIRVPRILPTGALGARVTVSVANEKAHPILFGVWMHPNSQLIADETQLSEAEFFSGWLKVVEKNVHKSVQVEAPQPLVEPYDIYIGSRVVGQPNVWFCHALVHDVSVLVETN
ncbi:MAG: glycosyltransferase [Rhodospirillales bacterium]|nr:glycosyltransferase [Rhodospirillales bacterium]